MTERTLARPRALVIGGSVGGLFAAHLLRGVGWDVAVFERAAGDLGDRGTGIGTREELFAVMRRIGLATDASIGIGVAGPRRPRSRRPASFMSCRCPPSPAPGRASGGRCGRRCRTPATPAARRWSRIEPRAERVGAIFDDGSRAEGDLLVAADGLHSTVRAQFLPELAPRYAGYVAWRGVVEADELSPELHDLMLHRMVFGFPDGELMLSIPMPAPRGDGQTRLPFRLVPAGRRKAPSPACAPTQSGRRHGVSIPPPLIRPELIAALKQDADALLAPQLAALVKATAQIILQPIFDLESPRIAFGRVALMGDAAFVARPHVATGVMKAAIDAESLAAALADSRDVECLASAATTTSASPTAPLWSPAAAISAPISPPAAATRAGASRA